MTNPTNDKKELKTEGSEGKKKLSGADLLKEQVAVISRQLLKKKVFNNLPEILREDYGD